jgi:ERCC4-type nuclease
MSASPLFLYEDTRCQAPMPWPPGVVVERKKLDEGDYSSERLWGIAAIELKRADFPQAVGSDRPRFDREVERLRPYRWRCIVVAQDFTSALRESAVHPHAAIGSIASWYAREDLPCFFVGNDHAAARLICGIIRRWQERLDAEEAAA